MQEGHYNENPGFKLRPEIKAAAERSGLPVAHVIESALSDSLEMIALGILAKNATLIFAASEGFRDAFMDMVATGSVDLDRVNKTRESLRAAGASLKGAMGAAADAAMAKSPEAVASLVLDVITAEGRILKSRAEGGAA